MKSPEYSHCAKSLSPIQLACQQDHVIEKLLKFEVGHKNGTISPCTTGSVSTYLKENKNNLCSMSLMSGLMSLNYIRQNLHRLGFPCAHSFCIQFISQIIMNCTLWFPAFREFVHFCEGQWRCLMPVAFLNQLQLETCSISQNEDEHWIFFIQHTCVSREYISLPCLTFQQK